MDTKPLAGSMLDEPRRFSMPPLRPLLLFLSVVLLTIIFIGLRFGLAIHRQQAAIQTIERLGGEVRIDDAGLWPWVSPEWKRALSRVDAVWLSSPQFTNAELVHLHDLPGLRSLSFTPPRESDSCIGFPAGSQERHKRSLVHAQITDAGLVHLRGLTRLRTLFLDSTPITDNGLVHVEKLTSLTGLTLEYTKITDAGMVHLQGLKNLYVLQLSDTQITDAGLANLKGFANLWLLLLNDVSITDLGLSYLTGLPDLQGLALDNTLVSDAGLVHLLGMPSLRGVSLIGTKVTPEGAADLQRKRPGLMVYR